MSASAAKPKTKKAVPSHPPFLLMIKDAIKDLKERNGSSRQAIIKKICSTHPKIDPKMCTTRVRLGLKSAVAKGLLVQVKGTGASGSFKLSEKAKAIEPAKAKKPVAKKAPAKAKKAAVAKPKKVAKKSPAKVKKAVAKKPKVVKAKKSPAKPKKPAVKKTPRKK